MKKLILSFLIICTSLIMRGQYTVGGDNADFPTLADAFYYLNNSGDQYGDVVLQLVDNSVETTPAIIYQSGYDGFTTYNSITIVPLSAGLTISGDVSGPLIDINGAANVIIDGNINGAANLIISNTSTHLLASTIRFSESASNCTVKNCYIKGSGLSTTTGVLFFSTAGSGSGNNNILIDNNFLTGNIAGKPVNAIYSAGTVDNDNKNITISNNKFLDHLNPVYGSFGINISSNNSLWAITGNSFYQQSPFSPTAAVSYVLISVANSGTGYTISGNHIGGQASSSSGAAWTKTGEYNNPFTGILFSAGAGNASTVNGNFIRNFNWSNSSSAIWTAIEIAGGDANVTSNEIGSSSGNGSITFTAGTNGGIFYGINITGNGTTTCQNNIIGSILAGNTLATGATHIHCISKAAVPGTTSFLNNNIGSNNTTNSIYASSASSSGNQLVSGIVNNGTGNITVSGNTIANITNGTTRISSVGTGRVIGIHSVNGTIIISGNTIYNLSIANNNTTNIATPSVCGISASGSTSKSANSNVIYGLSNSYSGFQGHVVGIYISGTGSVSLTKNFITGLSVNSSSSAASITGIRTGYGALSLTNNIISLNGDTRTTVTGIHETVGTGNTVSLYFNTVFIKGIVPSGVNKSYGLFSNVAADIRDYRNNIFYNERSTSGGSGLHYAAYFMSGGSITCNYNNYYVSGSGSVLGYYNGDKTTIPVVTGNDVNSLSVSPFFTAPGGTSSTDYKLTSNITGENGTGVTTDFGDFARTTPTVGAWEMMQNKWKGTVSTAYNLPGNWSGNSVPSENSDLEFDASAVNDCYLDADHIVKNVTNATARKLVANGHKLTITGTMALSGGALIDANAPASVLSLAGTTAQTINSADYTSGSVNDLIADNAAGITINSNFTINGNLTINIARSLVVSAPNILVVSGSISNNAGASGLILRSTANGTDARLINNTNLVSATVELFLSGGSGAYGPRFHYITPPVQTMSINNSSVSACATSLGLTSFYGDLLLFDESKATTSKNAGWQYFDSYAGTTGFNTLNSSRGYNMRLPVSGKMTFTGQLNAIQHTYSLSYTGSIAYPGWNLIGNPFPCNYDLTSISSFTAADNVDNTAYFNYDGGYGTWNFSLNSGTLNGSSSNVFSPVVAPMQGVYVHVIAPTTIDLPVSGKTANSSQPSRAKSSTNNYISEKIADLKKIKLSLNYNNLVDETLICLLDGATTGFDSDYDAYRLPEEISPRGWNGSLNNPSISTGAGSMKFAINSLPLPDPSGVTIVPVSLNIREAGSYTISTPEFENLEGMDVILKHGGVETKLSKGVIYKFNSLPGSYDNLALIIGSVTTGVEKTGRNDDVFKTWYKNDILYILSPVELYSPEARLVIYDVQGKPVTDRNILLTPGNIINIPINLQGGIYLAHIKADGRSFVTKFVVLQ